ncbi:MAG: glycosyltransferase family 2 protein [Beijerinckiaceae bacterium]|nr:glycosyltransferase family 2 protein [Beijerinckiaceae bacterium]
MSLILPSFEGISSSTALNSPLLSVVICTFNRASLLSGCLTELARQASGISSRAIDFLVVDNNSNDQTQQVCERFMMEWPSLRYVFEPSTGLSHARNRGAIESDSTYIAYLDDDAVAGPEYLQNVIAVLVSHEPDLAGGPMFPFYTSPKPFWFQDELEVRNHASETGFFDCPITGANFIIRRDILFRLGMFSVDYGMVGSKLRLGEERNLVEKYRSTTPPNERKIYYSQDCFIYHHVPAEKMKVGYFIRRAFESGRMRMALAKEFKNIETAVSIPVAEGTKPLKNILLGKKGIYFPLRAVHRLAMITGVFAFIAKDIFRSTDG